MDEVYAFQEVLQLAVEVEANGEKFYALMESQAKDELKLTWQYLKEQEKKHRQLFYQILEDAQDYFLQDGPALEYQSYMQALSHNLIFTRQIIEKRLKEGVKSEIEAFDFGIYLEKESIITYTTFKDYAIKSGRETIERIIQEEKKHLVDLMLLKQQALAAKNKKAKNLKK